MYNKRGIDQSNAPFVYVKKTASASHNDRGFYKLFLPVLRGVGSSLYCQYFT